MTGRQVAMHHGHMAVVRAIVAAAASVAVGEPQPGHAHAQAELAAGTAVGITGLTGAPQHNGKVGIVEGFDAAKDRYMVRVIGEAKPLRVKAANLQRVTGAVILMVAAQQGDVTVMGRMLDGGADPNALVQTDADDPMRPGQKRHAIVLIEALALPRVAVGAAASGGRRGASDDMDMERAIMMSLG
eukprot:COSAG01_NODE_4197_length_5250_cov_33.117453_3_plen_185_part_01